MDATIVDNWLLTGRSQEEIKHAHSCVKVKVIIDAVVFMFDIIQLVMLLIGFAIEHNSYISLITAEIGQLIFMFRIGLIWAYSNYLIVNTKDFVNEVNYFKKMIDMDINQDRINVNFTIVFFTFWTLKWDAIWAWKFLVFISIIICLLT